jgi:hypothetical protein
LQYNKPFIGGTSVLETIVKRGKETEEFSQRDGRKSDVLKKIGVLNFLLLMFAPFLTFLALFSLLSAKELYFNKMESETNPLVETAPSSDKAVSKVMQQGLEKMVVHTGVGLLVGGMLGVVLARGGASGARKVMAGTGAGIGLGSAWTRCSMDLEELLASSSQSK